MLTDAVRHVWGTADSFGSTLLAAFVYALFLQQCAFVGHDTAHNGITHDRKVLSHKQSLRGKGVHSRGG